MRQVRARTRQLMTDLKMNRLPLALAALAVLVPTIISQSNVV